MQSFVLLLPLLLLALAGRPAQQDTLGALAAPYDYNLVRYEVSALTEKLSFRLLASLRGDIPDERRGRESAVRFFQLRGDANRAHRELDAAVALRRAPEDIAPIEARLAALERQIEAVRPQVEYVLERDLRQTLVEQGLGGSFLGTRALFPPVQVHFASLPNVLIVSPRDRIQLKRTFLLDDSLSLAQMEQMEAQVARENLSGLVERVGGLATYPAIIPDSARLDSTLTTSAHEWMHHFLAFHPLGRAYWSNETMTTLNETVADTVGGEIGREVLRAYAPRPAQPPAPTQQDGASAAPRERDVFSFSREMRATRLQADTLLAQGKVDDAERYMEQRRQFLAEHGYYIRKLNQAYFAFHGTYADSAASASPIGGPPIGAQLAAVRARSASLADFLRTMASVGSVDDYNRLLIRMRVQ
ncbi:MAG: hypothetical protein Q7T26_04655 [Dehalococcoidia bacterium]|nr:hypothetical protein [Dehalococcoidia bacterium]